MDDFKEEICYPMDAACHNFTQVARTADREGMAIIREDRRFRYVVLDFEVYARLNSVMTMHKALIEAAAEAVLQENMEAFMELAK